MLVADCKKNWTSLRVSFRKALKNKTRSGQANTGTIKWKYEDIMSFMIPFYKGRDRKSNIQEIISQLMEASQVSFEEESNECTSVGQSEHSRPVSRNSPMSPLSSHSAASPSIPPKRQQSTPMAQVLQNYFEQKQNAKRVKKEDHLQKFFDAILETVRTFTPFLQIQIKSEIYNLVSEYELKNLMDQQQSTSGNMHFQKQDQPHSSQPQQNVNHSSLAQQSATFVSPHSTVRWFPK